MAIYHCSVKIIGRSKGKSVIAAAAYRAGEKLYDRETELTHDFSRKGGVVHREILLPDHAPKEYLDRQIFVTVICPWNSRLTTAATKDRESPLSQPYMRDFVQGRWSKGARCLTDASITVS